MVKDRLESLDARVAMDWAEGSTAFACEGIVYNLWMCRFTSFNDGIIENSPTNAVSRVVCFWEWNEEEFTTTNEASESYQWSGSP